MQNLLSIISRSLLYNKKPVIYQFLIIALLAAIITGSLLTGESVRESLRKSASEHLGNTGILISSGTRYADQRLATRINDLSALRCTGCLEIYGSIQGLNSQKVAPNAHIFAVSKEFFVFHGNDTVNIIPGEAAINKRLADYLGLKPGEDIIIRYRSISDIPYDAPFAPSDDNARSLVLKVGKILDSDHNGNFSLSVSQITPMNIFLSPEDIGEVSWKTYKINRLLINNSNALSVKEVSDILKKTLKPTDIGLRLRKVRKTGQVELISDRIFIDNTIFNEVRGILPSSAPVLTYLGNKFTHGSFSTPYSFISALPSSLYPGMVTGNNIIINKWLAEDLSAAKGDTISISWYAPDSLNKLIVKSDRFIIRNISDLTGIWCDSLLMPAFPGIAGKETCSGWDAGVPVKMNEIRPKDEQYWNRYRGTPKAFINYEKGREIWGNNFGPATSVRFPAEMTEEEIDAKLEGSIDPVKAGLTITDIAAESIKAADEGVDFGTLFLSLGFFLIVASFVLLSFAVSSYFDSRRKHIRTLFSLGFRNRWIERSLILETGIICLSGSVVGSIAGYLVDIIIIAALNSVWKGAVQTNTLGSYFNIPVVLTGLVLTLLFTIIFNVIKVKLYLSRLNKTRNNLNGKFSKFPYTILLIVFSVLTISLFVASILNTEQRSLLSFASGIVLLITFILLSQHYYTRGAVSGSIVSRKNNILSLSYYSANPSNAVTPILFIAAGIFSIFVTGANRMDFNDSQMKRSGGTGGYLLWCENSIPVKEDLTNVTVRNSLGLNDSTFRDMRFIQMKRSAGNDASCLNLNHVTAPPLLGVDPTVFINNKSFSFSGSIKSGTIKDPWSYLKISSEKSIVYGIADQTVLEWGLKMKIGDTLVLGSENGAPLKIIIAAGLQSSVFQGNVLIGIQNFTHYFPSVSGSSVLLVDGDRVRSDAYKTALEDRFEKNGIDIQPTSDRLASFYEVTNTYLSVFGVFGAFGMILGIGGLGFVLLRNYNNRKYAFALMLATGFRMKKIRAMILREQLLILFAGVISGVVSAVVATLPSLLNNHDIPWILLIIMTLAIIVTGLITLSLSMRSITGESLVESLKRE